MTENYVLWLIVILLNGRTGDNIRQNIARLTTMNVKDAINKAALFRMAGMFLHWNLSGRSITSQSVGCRPRTPHVEEYYNIWFVNNPRAHRLTTPFHVNRKASKTWLGCVIQSTGAEGQIQGDISVWWGMAGELTLLINNDWAHKQPKVIPL